MRHDIVLVSILGLLIMPTSALMSDQNLAMGSNGHTCSIMMNGKLLCWGNNLEGQCGIKPLPPSTFTNLIFERYPNPVDLGPGKTANAVVAGMTHTCAILSDRSVKCWGNNNIGQLGRGENANGLKTNDFRPMTVNLTSNAVSISAGYSHTCVILEDTTTWCWGVNSLGMLGVGNQENQFTPVKMDLTPGKHAIRVVCSPFATYVTLNDTTILQMGAVLDENATNNELDMQLPMGTKMLSSPEPLPLEELPESMAVGFSHMCGIFGGGSLRCWGKNYGTTPNSPKVHGFLGTSDNTTDYLWTPTDIDLGDNATAISVVISGQTTCATLSTGSLWCWGLNTGGAVGIGSGEDLVASPQQVGLGGVTVAEISGGGLSGNRCAILNNQSLVCWGGNDKGILGTCSHLPQRSPALVDLLMDCGEFLIRFIL